MTAILNRSLAFLFGFGFSLLPVAAPFLALLILPTSRWRVRRLDLAWGLAALLAALGLGIHQGISGATFGILQTGAAWLVFRSFAQLRRASPLVLRSSLTGLGLIFGLALVVLLGWLRIDQLNLSTAKTLAQAIVWGSVPALYGHTVLVLGALIAILSPTARLRLLSLGLSALGILVSGSREAAIAWVFIALLLLLTGKRRSGRSLTLEVVLLMAMLAIAAGLGPWLGWGRVGFLLSLDARAGSTNLLQGTEIARGDWWDSSQVHFTTATELVGDQPLTVYRVTKPGAEHWLRLQQIIPITPGESYTVSAWLRPEAESQPGIQGWGQYRQDGEVTTFAIVAALSERGWTASASGAGEVVAAGIESREGEWQRAFVTFTFRGETPSLFLHLGLTPDSRPRAGTASSFAGFQLERGPEVSAYTPGPATEGLGFGVARLPYWQTAWQGTKERPLFGWGSGVFPDYFDENWPDRRILDEVPAHTHSLFLETLFERGLFGLAGLLIFITALSWSAIRRRDLPFLIVVAAVLIANIFDNTLYYGGVIYPLAAVAGWRAAAGHKRAAAGDEAARQAVVRMALVVTDFLMVLLSLYLALLLQRWVGDLLGLPVLNTTLPTTLFYTLLLWPAMSWREGLFPGYGLSPPQELGKQVAATAYAGLILAAGTVLLTNSLPLSRSVLLLLVGLSTILLPIGRSLIKRLLHRLSLWGRPVVILGAGRLGRRVAEALLRTPLIGLQPLALFDDDPEKRGKRIGGLRVRGSLSEADAFAERHGVSHAIIAIPSLSPGTLIELIDTKGKSFRQVQFVPELMDLPTEGVSARNLGGMLALEIRNGLYLRRNRIFKRAIDLLGATVGGLMITPLLLLLYLWIRFDSRGPGFYWSERIGEGGRHFRCLKFRTMFVGAEGELEALFSQRPEFRAEWEANHKLHHDPRITRVGRFLRETSLDELPQLWNVLKGEMSLVGPRPIVEAEIEKYDQVFGSYQVVQPGMTGYWQVSGRSDTSYTHRTELDSFYVRNWSLWFDIIILVKTLPAVLQRRGAR